MSITQTWSEARDARPTGGDLVEPSVTSTTRTDLTDLREGFATLRDTSRIIHDLSAGGHEQVRRADLDQLAAENGRMQLQEVLTLISSRGFAWRDIARCLGVSVPALRKWRHGESATPANRAKAARFLAICEYLEHNALNPDVAGWFEFPLVPDPAITPLDLYAEGHESLVLDYAEHQEPDPIAVLDRYDPDWRSRRSDFEVILAEDGMPSIQRRS